MTEKGNLNLLNLDDRFRGTYTWEARGYRSAIDLVMGNDRLTGRVIGIEIDEGKEIVDLSDHNLVEVRIRGDRIEKEKRKQREQVKYYSLGKEELRVYVKGVERRVQEHRIEDIRKFNRTIEEVAGQKLDRTYTRRVGKETGNKEPP